MILDPHVTFGDIVRSLKKAKLVLNSVMVYYFVLNRNLKFNLQIVVMLHQII